MNAEYKSPKEWGKCSSFLISRLFFSAIATVVVAHSPTPSKVKIIDSLYGDGKKALAAWLKWCSENFILSMSLKSLSCLFRFSNINFLWFLQY